MESFTIEFVSKASAQLFPDLEPGLYPSITDIVEAMNILLNKDTITAKTVSKLKCLEEHKKLRFTLQMKNPVLHSLVGIWDTFSEVMLVMNLEYC